jgi:syntaxin 18
MQSSGISQLHNQLLTFRQAYLSTAAPRKTQHRLSLKTGANYPSQPLSLTDREREEIDANAKRHLRDLNALIRALADAEEVRQHTESAVLAKKYRRGLGGALGTWASGGGGDPDAGKSVEYRAAEEKARQLGAHRESVLWFLRERLKVVGGLQQAMMEVRLRREVEKNKSVLANARVGTGVGMGMVGGLGGVEGVIGGAGGSSRSLPVDELDGKRTAAADHLTDEQVQMFEQDNQDMLKYYQGTLDKVRYVCAASGRANMWTLTFGQDRRTIAHRDRRAAEYTGGEFGDAIRTH